MRRAPSAPHRPRGLPGLFLLFLLSFLQPAVASAYLPAFWDNFWPENVAVGPEGVKVFVGYSLPPEPIREARSGNADLAVRQTQPWVEGSRLASRPFQLNLTAWSVEGDPSTLAPVWVTARDAALLPIVAHCFMPAPKERPSMDGREVLAVEMRWRNGQAQPFAIDSGALRAPVTEERKSAILACMQAAMAGQRGFAGPARRLRLQNRSLPRVQRTCLTAPPEDGVSEIIALTPQSNLPDLMLDDSARSAAWKERRACLEAETRRPSPNSVGSVTQTFVPVASASAISQDFKPSIDQLQTSVGECFKRVDLPDGNTSVHASWPIGAGGRLGAGRLTSEDRLPSASLPCLRRAIARVSLLPVPQTTGDFRLEFRVFTRSSSSSRIYRGDIGPPGPEHDWALELMRKRPPRGSLLLVLPYALIATPLPVLPVEPPLPPPPPPPPPPAVTTRVGSGRPPPESFGFTPPARADLDAMQRCLDVCVSGGAADDGRDVGLVSEVTFVRPACEPASGGERGNCLATDPAAACAAQCAREQSVDQDFYLGAHPDDVVQPEPSPLLAVVFGGPSKPPSSGCDEFESVAEALTKRAVAAQPAVQRCFLDAAEEEAVPDWVNLRVKYERDGRVASVNGWEGMGGEVLVGCLSMAATAWNLPQAMQASRPTDPVLMLVSLRRDSRAMRFAGWDARLLRGIDRARFEPLLPSKAARRLAEFKRHTLGSIGLERHFSEVVSVTLVLLIAILSFVVRRRHRRRSLRAASQSD